MNIPIRKTGEYEKYGDKEHFIPAYLPPDPPIVMDNEAIELYGDAMVNLGRLDEMLRRIPDSKRFLRSYIIKEALLSSEIEGIHTTLIEVFGYNEGKPTSNSKDIQLVINYIKAVDYAMKMVSEDGLPIVSRVIRGSHKALLSGTEDDSDTPGLFRKVPVRVGSLVPPPAQKIEDLIFDLEKFINENRVIPPLLKAGIAHVQFETIHPFLDGNGRIGRMLVVLMLVYDGLISEPLLYPSYYFKKYRSEYYARLDNIRTKGDWEGWTKYYLRAISKTAVDAHSRAQEIEKINDDLREKIIKSDLMRKNDDALFLLSWLFQQPIVTINSVADKLDKSYPAAQHLVNIFQKIGILSVDKKQKRNRIYKFSSYIDVLENDFLI